MGVSTKGNFAESAPTCQHEYFRRPAVESRHGSAVAKALFLVHVGADSIREHEYLARYIDTCGMFELYLVSTYGGCGVARQRDNVWNVGENVGF